MKEKNDTTAEADYSSMPIPSGRSRFKLRHLFVLLSFILFVVAPAAICIWYFSARAADQFSSTVGFTVRQEETSSGLDILGGVASLGSSGTSDTDILFEYIQSQELVAKINTSLDLKALYSKPDNDPVFSFDPSDPIEELVRYWSRMVKIYYNSSTQLIELQVLAFSPEDATRIAQEIFDESSLLINRLSAIAQSDATRFAKLELDNAVERLKSVRQIISKFRSDNLIVDPNVDLQSQMGILSSLQQQLAEALIEQDLLDKTASRQDARKDQISRKIAAIEARIAQERAKLGGSGPENMRFTDLLTTYEEMRVDLEFAQTSYVSALATYDSALSDARRKSRYLAAYIEPTQAETSQFPKRTTITGMITFFLFLIWSIGTLVFYSVRDRQA
ncbi:hypothetical protein GCM10008927_11730 [Amylibacter ulvae]|uniref:Capsular polysaccharide transport system permease protein n=1 Tax=Paramylibacter ulvae TaxID=1651968 RepID=A0ABQ3CZR2_9RHOB|nr:hypothetical protein [Amylibacter ulvae]GHA48322.1 hypothetical protein GCM10008927_11730 [Amylibacter ulvae]